MASTTRVLALALAIAAGALLVAIALLFLVWPTWLGGGVCELTIEDIFVRNDGRAELRITTTLPYGAELAWDFPPGRNPNYTFCQAWDEAPSRFLRWPSRAAQQPLLIPLVIEAEEDTVPERLDAVSARLLLKKGRYRFRIGEQLVYYRREAADGRSVECVIRCQSAP